MTGENEKSALMEDKKKRRGASWIRQQFGRGMTYFLVIAMSILFYFALLRLDSITRVFWDVIDVLKPVLYGMGIAYLLNPIVRKVDRYFVPVLQKKMKNNKKAAQCSRAVGIGLAVVFLCLLIVALCNMLIPELYKSIRDLVVALPGLTNELLSRMNEISFKDSAISAILKEGVEQGTEMFQTWVRTDLFGQINQLMTSLTEGILTALGELFNAVLGIIVSVYLLFSKEKFMRQVRKTVYAAIPSHTANLILELARKSNEIFGGFIIGKIIDSAIIGVLCFIGISLLDMPYVMLVSVIVGVTNVIPFFGPYIGAIPCSILILLTDPLKGVYFIIFIFLLQQLDGNFIGPKILGNSTGLSAFWVIFAILLGGGMFGILGMLIGVPAFAVIYYIIKLAVNSRLEKKNLPSSSDCYDEEDFVDDNGIYVPSKRNKGE